MGRFKTINERIEKGTRKNKRGGGAPMGRTIGVSSTKGYGLHFGNEWHEVKTAGEYYERKYGIKFERPEFEQIYFMPRNQRRCYCLHRMKHETGNTKSL